MIEEIGEHIRTALARGDNVTRLVISSDVWEELCSELGFSPENTQTLFGYPVEIDG